MAGFKPEGFITEIGGGGVVTTHCDYGQCDWKVNKYEPEEYQQIVAENNFQKAFHGDNGHLGHVLRVVPARIQRHEVQRAGRPQLEGSDHLRR